MSTTPAAGAAAAAAGAWIAVAGNPNSGKTTLFNALTGLRQKVGNYPGVTVEKKQGRCFGSHGEPMEVLDLPGTYSLQTSTPDEMVARDVLLGRRPDTPPPDVILCVVDATNLERHLYLVGQLLELGRPLVVALNLADVAEARGMAVDAATLGRRLGVPVVPTVATRKKGLVELRQALTAVVTASRRAGAVAPGVPPPLPRAIEEQAARVAEALGPREGVAAPQARAVALQLLAAPAGARGDLAGGGEAMEAVARAREALAAQGIDPALAIVEARYAWAAAEAAVAVRRSGPDGAETWSDRIDAWLTHGFWGWVFFVAVMALMFVTIFTVAAWPMDWIDGGFGWLGERLGSVLPDGAFRGLVVDGIVAGVGGVVIFLPQILLLFLFIGLLEDSGYMARAAFLVDRLMARVGLQGRSFIPLLSSFACAIPGIMAARSIDSPRDRLVTIFVAPFMSCSARLPVYSLLLAVLLPLGAPWVKATVVLGLYFLGMAAAFGTAWLLRGTLLRGPPSMLLLEMPPYRRPAATAVLLRMVERAGIFLRRAGTVILALSVLLLAAATYPRHPDAEAPAGEQLAHSVAGRVGRAIEPVLLPLGFDWKIGIGLVSSLAAREVFVGTMAIVYSVEGGEEDEAGLAAVVREQRRPDGTPVYTPLVCVGLLVFYVLALQCLSTVAIVRRETGGWKWPLLQLGYMTGLAWLAALVVYQGGRLLGFT